MPDWAEGGGEAVQFDVLGFGHTRAEGLKAGMVTHLDTAEQCIRAAVDAAERMAGVVVEDVHLSVTAGRLKSDSFSAGVGLPSGSVREDDVQRLLAGGRQYAARDQPDRDFTLCPRIFASTTTAASPSPAACAVNACRSICTPSPRTKPRPEI